MTEGRGPDSPQAEAEATVLTKLVRVAVLRNRRRPGATTPEWSSAAHGDCENEWFFGGLISVEACGDARRSCCENELPARRPSFPTEGERVP